MEHIHSFRTALSNVIYIYINQSFTEICTFLDHWVCFSHKDHQLTPECKWFQVLLSNICSPQWRENLTDTNTHTRCVCYMWLWTRWWRGRMCVCACLIKWKREFIIEKKYSPANKALIEKSDEILISRIINLSKIKTSGKRTASERPTAHILYETHEFHS